MRINKSFDSLVGILQANKCETPQIIICKRREEFSNFCREILIRKFYLNNYEKNSNADIFEYSDLSSNIRILISSFQTRSNQFKL